MEKKLAPELLEKAKQAKTAEELIALAKEKGAELSEESAKAYFDQLHKTGELSDDELDNVAGGGCSKDGRPVVTAVARCEGFKCGDCHNYTGLDAEVCWKCRQIINCGSCEYSHYEGGLLICYNPENYGN